MNRFLRFFTGCKFGFRTPMIRNIGLRVLPISTVLTAINSEGKQTETANSVDKLYAKTMEQSKGRKERVLQLLDSVKKLHELNDYTSETARLIIGIDYHLEKQHYINDTEITFMGVLSDTHVEALQKSGYDVRKNNGYTCPATTITCAQP